MNALVFSDLHASSKQLFNLKKFCIENKTKIVLLIFAGDAVNQGEPIGFMVNFIEALNEIDLPFFWVPGNNDFGRSYHKLQAIFPSLEGKIIHFHNIVLTGVGGSPASWAGQYAGEKMIDAKSIADSIFVSHQPPPGILVMNKYDWKPSTNSVISTPHEVGVEKSFSDKISRQARDDIAVGRKFSDAPRLHICGHLHSHWGCGYLGTTKVINPGSLADGRYAIINLENLITEFGRFY